MYVIHEYPHYIQYEVVRKGGAAEFALGRSDSVKKDVRCVSHPVAHVVIDFPTHPCWWKVYHPKLLEQTV